MFFRRKKQINYEKIHSITEAIEATGLNKLKAGDLCIFAGAGISLKSGIPVVWEIKNYIINKISDIDDDKDLLLKNTIPFEAFMEVVLTNYLPTVSNVFTDNLTEEEKLRVVAEALAAIAGVLDKKSVIHRNFFTLFDSPAYQPNLNHYLIAEMLISGKSKVAVTTNFDLLIEKAYKEITNEEITVYFPSQNSTGRYTFPCLIKVHGGCQKPETIQTVLSRIASKEGVESCKRAIDYTFNSGEHSTVLTVGYSFSDIFDISPAIDSIKKSKKKIVNVNYDPPGFSCYPIDEKQTIFKNFEGIQINCITDDVMQSLGEIYFDNKKINIPPSKKIEIEEILDLWAKDLSEPYNKYMICGLLMTYLSRTDRAKFYFQECLNTDKAKDDAQFRNLVLQNLIAVDTNCKKEIAGESEVEQKIKLLINAIPVLILTGDLKQIESNCNEALNLAIGAKNKKMEGLARIAYTYFLNEKKDYKKAIKEGEKAELLLEDDGDFETLKSCCRLYSYLSTSFLNTGNEKKKKEYLDKCILLAKKLGNENEIAAIYFNWANSVNVDTHANRKEGLRKAIDYFKMGYSFCESIDYIEKKDKNEPKKFIMPMLKDSAYNMLGIYIVNLYDEDKSLIKDNELDLACKVLEDKFEKRSLSQYGSGNAVELVSMEFMMKIFVIQRKYKDFFEKIASQMKNKDIILSGAYLKKMIYCLIICFQDQEENEHDSLPEHGMSSDYIQSTAALLAKGSDCFTSQNIREGVVLLNEAFVNIPMHVSLKNTLPFGIYREIMNIRRTLMQLYELI